MTITEHPPKTSRLACLEEDEENEEAESPPSSSLKTDETGGTYQRFLIVVMQDPSEVDDATIVPSEDEVSSIFLEDHR